MTAAISFNQNAVAVSEQVTVRHQLNFSNWIIVAEHDQSWHVDIRNEPTTRYISIQHMCRRVVEKSSSESTIKVKQTFAGSHLTENFLGKIIQLFKSLLYERLRDRFAKYLVIDPIECVLKLETSCKHVKRITYGHRCVYSALIGFLSVVAQIS